MGNALRRDGLAIWLITLITFCPAGTLADDRKRTETQRIELTGEYHLAIAESYDAEPPNYYHTLKLGEQYLELNLGNRTSNLQTGDTVKVTGTRRGDEVDVESLQKLQDGSAGDRASLVASRSVALFFLNFSDKELESNTMSDAIEAMYSEQYSPIDLDGNPTPVSAAHVNESLQLSSFGRVSLNEDANGDGEIDVFGPYDLSLPSTSCGLHQAWANAADLYAELEGADLSIYQHRVYVVPHHLCGWNGLAIVGCGNNCRLWSRTPWTQTLAHEFGHNFGLWHAAADVNGDGDIDDLESIADKGVMMASGNFQLSGHLVHAPQRHALGWFDSLPSAVAEVDATGTFYLNDLQDTAGVNAQTLRFTLDTPTGTRELFAAYRRSDLDQYDLVNSYFAPVADIADTIRVHECSNAACTRTLLKATLRDGEHYLDHTADSSSYPLLIEAASASGEAATVNVYYGDSDNDGVLDYEDNCSAIPNPSQIDADCDGFGNLCDGDFNNDGVVNVQDLGLLRVSFFTDDGQTDLNSDGVVNAVDLGLFRTLTFQPPGPSGPLNACAS